MLDCMERRSTDPEERRRRRCKVVGPLRSKRKEWAKHWQCDESVQNMEDKLGKHEDLKKIRGSVTKANRVRTGKSVGIVQRENRSRMRWRPPTNPLGLTKETRREIVNLLEKVEQRGKWPRQACTTMFFLIPKNVTSERPIALVPTLTRWWEAEREHLWWRSVNISTALLGTLLMAEMEELSRQSGKICWRWRGSNTEQGKNNWMRWHWCWTW